MEATDLRLTVYEWLKKPLKSVHLFFNVVVSMIAQSNRFGYNASPFSN